MQLTGDNAETANILGFTNLVLLWMLTGALHLSFECPDSTSNFLQSERTLHVGLQW